MISHVCADGMRLRCFLLLFHILNKKQSIHSDKNILCFIDLVIPKAFPEAGVMDFICSSGSCPPLVAGSLG